MEKHGHKWHIEEGRPLSDETIARLGNPARLLELPPEKWLAALGEIRGKKVADVACGTGVFTPYLADAAGEDGIVYAIDIDSRMVEYAAKKFASRKNIRAVKSENAHIPLESACLDGAIMISTFHDLDGDATLREIYRTLAPKGRLVVVDWKKGAKGMGPPDEIRLDAIDAAKILSNIGFDASEFGVSESAWGILAVKR